MPTPTDLNTALKGLTVKAVETPGQMTANPWPEADTVIITFTDGLKLRFDGTGYEVEGVAWKVLSV